MDEYRISFFRNLITGHTPVQEYIDGLANKDQTKVIKYIEYLRQNNGVLDEPYTRHIRGKIRELRVDFGNNRHRIFFFTFIGKKIVLLHAFQKSTAKTPEREIIKAVTNYDLVISNPNNHEKK